MSFELWVYQEMEYLFEQRKDRMFGGIQHSEIVLMMFIWISILSKFGW